MDITRQLATIRAVSSIQPIEGADMIELAFVDGWQTVVKKGEFQAGDRVVYFEIDSWIPTALAPFLSKGKEPRVYKSIAGERLRTVKLRKQLSQGLIMHPPAEQLGRGIGHDCTEELGILKWEQEVSAQLRGSAKGNFPSDIPKTDQNRIQNVYGSVSSHLADTYEVTEKLHGSSMTVYIKGGEFGVCSRNLDLKEEEGNSFRIAANNEGLREKLGELEGYNIAIQGELIGPGICGNNYGRESFEFYVFDIYDIDMRSYMTADARGSLCETLGLNQVPVISTTARLPDTLEDILAMAEKESLLAKTTREGLVWKNQRDPNLSFKVISNKWLLEEK